MSFDDTVYKVKALGSLLRLVAKSAFNRADPNSLDNIFLRLESTARSFPNQEAILFEGKVITWRELHEYASRVSNALVNDGVQPGDCVAFLFDNGIDFVANLLGCLGVGARVALINTNLRGSQLVHCVNATGATRLIFGDEHWAVIADVLEEGEQLASIEMLWVGEKDAPFWAKNFSESTSSASSDYSPILVKRNECAMYVFTSGTTGLPKAAIQTHHKILQAMDRAPDLGVRLSHKDRFYLCLPLYHATGLLVALFPCIRVGATIVLRRKFSASHFLDEVRQYNCNIFAYIGELCRYLVAQPMGEADGVNPLRKVVGNGLRPDIWTEFQDRYQIDEVFEFYGSSEGNTGFMNLFNRRQTIGAALFPAKLVEYDVKRDEIIRNESGFCVPVRQGEPGLLLGPISKTARFEGYTDKAATEKKVVRNVFEEGDAYFNTGDLVKQIDVGFTFGFKHYQFVDRVGDTFRWKGENCSTNEISEIINTHPDVLISNVYGVEVPGNEGRAGMAAVVLKEGVASLSPSFLQLVTDNLAPYARPLFVRVKKDLQLTGTMKLVKHELVEDAYHLDKIDDPILFLQPDPLRYEQLERATYDLLQSGEARL